MPATGNYYVIALKKTHLGWGTYRRTNSREKIKDEGYLPIPARFARLFNITNSNCKTQSNIYKFSTSDDFFQDKELKASGNSKSKDRYAKNLHGSGDLKLLGKWFRHIGVEIGDKIKVEFTSPDHILLTKL